MTRALTALALALTLALAANAALMAHHALVLHGQIVEARRLGGEIADLRVTLELMQARADLALGRGTERWHGHDTQHGSN